jgi:hypothetical protein
MVKHVIFNKIHHKIPNGTLFGEQPLLSKDGSLFGEQPITHNGTSMSGVLR